MKRAYRVLVNFTDMHDNGHKYAAGDNYPRRGYKPTEERILELSTNKNRRKIRLIEDVKEQS